MATLSITIPANFLAELNALAQRQGHQDVRAFLIRKLKELIQEERRRAAIETAMQQAESDTAGIA